MPLLSAADHRFAAAVGQLSHGNPFLPERIDAERAALGTQFDERNAAWNLRPDQQESHPNIERLVQRAEQTLARGHAQLARGKAFDDGEDVLYDDLVLFVLYHHHRLTLDRLISRPADSGGKGGAGAVFAAMVEMARRFLVVDGKPLPLLAELPHVFAGFFQIRRAYKNIFDFILGTSRPAVRLRATVWQSIFTHDMRRYRRLLFRQMGEFTTLVTGPSGTGKELVARAVGLSQYVPFDQQAGKFVQDFAGSFHPVNLSALSPTLIESELFGHRRGAFTGAVADRLGWLEICPALGAVFLDEIGDVEPSIQVKLLRVLQTRQFSRLGETTTRRFEGKIIAATNRDLVAEMQSGRFRDDLYYRLCSDVIQTPSLRQRVADQPDELRHLIGHMAQRLVGAEAAEEIVSETMAVIDAQLGPGYEWPGNVRELEQCVRNVVIRKEYRRQRRTAESPANEVPAAIPLDRADELAAELRAGSMTADEVLRRYCTLVYAQTGSYEAAAARLKIDRRTVKAKVDPQLLGTLESEATQPRQ